MTTPNPAERVRAAVAATAERLATPFALAEGGDTPTPGQRYAFDAGNDIGLEWLVVRAHPDDNDTLLLAPLDDFPLVGTPDVALPGEAWGRPVAVRCGQAEWFPARLCAPRLRAGEVSADALSLVRRRLADLARGRTPEPEDPTADFDPEYEAWMSEVARAAGALAARAATPPTGPLDCVHVQSLSSTPPAQLASTPELSLAAEDGGSLFAELGQSLAESDVKYHEVPGVPGGNLVLTIDDSGVLAVWEGLLAQAPSVAVADDESPVPWLSGPEGQLHRTERVLPWIDGRVVLDLGTDPCRRLAFQL